MSGARGRDAFEGGKVYTLPHTGQPACDPCPPCRPARTATPRHRPAAALKAIRARPAARRADSSADGTTTQRIVDAITTAIVERRLMPGTKLAEQQIADIFKVSRTLVRQALNQLARPPGDAGARARRLRRPAQRGRGAPGVRGAPPARKRHRAPAVRQHHRRADLAQLRAHLHAEADAVARTDVAGRTRCWPTSTCCWRGCWATRCWPQLLADLLSRSQLISLMYQSSHSAEHSSAEHVAIVDALQRRDARAATRLMEAHLPRRTQPAAAPACQRPGIRPEDTMNPTPRYPRDLRGYGRQPAARPLARWRPRGGAVRAELRGRRREQRAARRCRQRAVPVRDVQRGGLPGTGTSAWRASTNTAAAWACGASCASSSAAACR
jgi:DNA-binding GntR family transcriptional regulator